MKHVFLVVLPKYIGTVSVGKCYNCTSYLGCFVLSFRKATYHVFTSDF